MSFYLKPLLFITFFLTSFIIEKKSTNLAALSCRLSSDKPFYKVGELPKFTVEITNNGIGDVYLIGSLDGSDVKWRFPYCYYSIERPSIDTTRLERCGNVNPLRIADFKLVKPGQKFNPYEIIDGYGFFGDYTTLNEETFKIPGIYKLRFHYSTNSQNISDFIGERYNGRDKSDSTKIDAFLKRVPKVDIESNEIEIVVYGHSL